jgi:hypothetical protein
VTTAREIAAALGGRRAQRLGDGSFLVPCPVPSHGKGRGDRSPSLRIGDGQTRLLVHCYAGCDPRDVLTELRRRELLDGELSDPSERTPPRRVNLTEDQERARKLALAGRIWNEAVHIEGTPGALYFYKRNIDITLAPDFGGLRWHKQCPWLGGPIGCVLARFTDAITGEVRGIWRRPIKKGEKPRTLGPMGGCVIRLWPDEAVTTGLVIGEGIETTLAAALHVEHRGTLLQPAWATGCAANMADFPVLAGIEALTILVDNDKSSTGQDAAAACARRWLAAGREVIRLTPKTIGTDFNDIIKGSAA